MCSPEMNRIIHPQLKLSLSKNLIILIASNRLTFSILNNRCPLRWVLRSRTVPTVSSQTRGKVWQRPLPDTVKDSFRYLVRCCPNVASSLRVCQICVPWYRATCSRLLSPRRHLSLESKSQKKLEVTITLFLHLKKVRKTPLALLFSVQQTSPSLKKLRLPMAVASGVPWSAKRNRTRKSMMCSKKSTVRPLSLSW